jgi:Phage capsid family
MEKNELLSELTSLKTALEATFSEKAKSEIANEIKSILAQVDDKIKAANTGDNLAAVTEELAALKSEHAALVKGFDLLQTRVKSSGNKNAETKKSFGEVFAENLEKNFDNIQNVKKGQPFRMEMKAVGTMLLSANLTGDGVASYAANQAILPAQKINFRDLIPTAVSPTGLYVQYRETGGEGSIAQQTEGSSKGQVDYDFTEVKVVENYIAGFARFSKQMAKQLNYMQTTLPRLLMRDFYKKENGLFYASVWAAATGSTTTSETDDVKAIMDLLANQANANFNASFAIVNPTQMARLNKLLYTNGYYQGSGGVVSQPNGGITINGTPIISASWATDDRVLIIDRDYLERVETEAMTIEFSMEDGDNFTKNLITARIECQEEINLMLPTSAIALDLGNVA